MSRWIVPKMWPGGTAYILGGGPSLLSADLSRLYNQNVIAVNQAFNLGPWPVLFWGDCSWLDQNYADVMAFCGLRVTCCERQTKVPGVLVVKRQRGQYGISNDPATILWNSSSGAAAINLAYHFGVSKIVLLGYDMRRIDGRNNYHNDYPPPRTEDPYERFLRPFPAIAAALKAKHVEVINATPGSALKVWPICEPSEVLPQPETAKC
jgi:hypothetical protein